MSEQEPQLATQFSSCEQLSLFKNDMCKPPESATIATSVTPLSSNVTLCSDLPCNESKNSTAVSNITQQDRNRSMCCVNSSMMINKMIKIDKSIQDLNVTLQRIADRLESLPLDFSRQEQAILKTQTYELLPQHATTLSATTEGSVSSVLESKNLEAAQLSKSKVSCSPEEFLCRNENENTNDRVQPLRAFKFPQYTTGNTFKTLPTDLVHGAAAGKKQIAREQQRQFLLEERARKVMNTILCGTSSTSLTSDQTPSVSRSDLPKAAEPVRPGRNPLFDD